MPRNPLPVLDNVGGGMAPREPAIGSKEEQLVLAFMITLVLSSNFPFLFSPAAELSLS